MGSVLSEPRKRLYVANGLYLLDPYTEITDSIQSRGCKSVGVAILGNGAEYPIWVFLGAPTEELDIGWIVAGTPSAAFADPGFEPCAIICEDCQSDRARIAGLPRVLIGEDSSYSRPSENNRNSIRK